MLQDLIVEDLINNPKPYAIVVCGSDSHATLSLLALKGRLSDLFSVECHKDKHGEYLSILNTDMTSRSVFRFMSISRGITPFLRLALDPGKFYYIDDYARNQDQAVESWLARNHKNAAAPKQWKPSHQTS